MHLFLLEIESGVVLAAVYALLSVSLTFTYRATGVVQLAQGDVMMCGAFAAFFAARVTHNLAAVVVAGAAASMVVGLIAYLSIFRFLIKEGHLPPLVAGLALSAILEEALRNLFFHGQSEPFPRLDWVSTLSTHHLNALIVAVAVVIGVGFEGVLRFTRAGREVRATSDNADVARLLGVNAAARRTMAFALSSALAGVAGVLLALVYGSISFHTGASLEFVAVAAILLGGLGSVPGALIGALVLGLGSALISTYVSSGYVNGLVFLIVLVVIVARPSGLLGKDFGSRA